MVPVVKERVEHMNPCASCTYRNIYGRENEDAQVQGNTLSYIRVYLLNG